MQRHPKLKFLGVLCVSVVQLFLWTACAPPATPSPNQQTATALQSSFNTQYFLATQRAMVMTAQASGGQPFIVVTAPIPVTIVPVGTLQALTAEPCTFLWTTQDLPEVTSAAQNAFGRVSILADVSVRAQAYGENCINPDGSVRYFNVTTTDFFLTTELASVGDLETVAQIVVAALDALNAPLGVQLPAKPGYLDMIVTTSDGFGHLRTTFEQIAFARTQGLTGGALVDALGGVVQR